MPFDGISTCASAAECAGCFTGAKIQRVYQPLKDDIIIYFANRDKGLLLSADPSFSRAYVSADKYDNPEYPPAFCMLLRKYLIGGIVKSISQRDFDRIIDIHIEALTDAGVLSELCLTAELMGRHANIILYETQSGHILDAVKHISAAKSSVRRVMPGGNYTAPPNDKLNIFDFDIHSALSMFSFASIRSGEALLADIFSGISQQCARSYFVESGEDADSVKDMNAEQAEAFFGRFAAFIKKQTLSADNFIYIDERGGYRDFSHGKYTFPNDCTAAKFVSFSDAAAEFYRGKTQRSGVKERNAAVIGRIETVLAREKRKLAARLQEDAAAQDSERYAVTGNLLLANMHLLEKGMTSVEVSDFYDADSPIVTIPLKEEYTPSQNAQYYFRKYAKAKSAAAHLRSLIAEAENAVFFLSSQLYFLSEAENEAEAETVFAELEKAGYVKRRRSKKPAASRKQPYGELITDDGFKIMYGRNSRQNDELTFRAAAKDDIWLHVKDMVGSHVIIKTAGVECSSSALLCAAETAAFNSAGRSGSKVPVDYTFVKNVKKTAGAAAGRVTFTDNRTLYVTPVDHTHHNGGGRKDDRA